MVTSSSKEKYFIGGLETGASSDIQETGWLVFSRPCKMGAAQVLILEIDSSFFGDGSEGPITAFHSTRAQIPFCCSLTIS